MPYSGALSDCVSFLVFNYCYMYIGADVVTAKYCQRSETAFVAMKFQE